MVKHRPPQSRKEYGMKATNNLRRIKKMLRRRDNLGSKEAKIKAFGVLRNDYFWKPFTGVNWRWI